MSELSVPLSQLCESCNRILRIDISDSHLPSSKFDSCEHAVISENEEKALFDELLHWTVDILPIIQNANASTPLIQISFDFVTSVF